jgi:methionyl-tRNA synthetase
VEELLDGAELTQALGEIWDRVRRLNRYVEESRPWDLAKEESRAADLDRVLYSLAEGVHVLALLLLPYMPATCERLLDALAEPGRELAELGSRGGGQTVERIPPLFPKLET